MASGSSSADVRKGLDLIAQAMRTRLSRALHDKVGPALCGAGLQLSIVRKPVEADAVEALEAVRQALAETVETVRALSYETHPALAARCGLEGGLRALAASYGCAAAWDGAPAADPGQAEGICRVAGSLMASTGAVAGLRSGERGVEIRLRPGERLPPDLLAALKWLARQARLGLQYSHRDTETTISVRPVRERKPR